MQNNVSTIFSHFFGRLVSLNFFRKIARFFHLQNLVKKVYFFLLAPKNKIISYQIENLRAQFYVKNYQSLLYFSQTIMASGADESQTMKILLDNINENDIIYDIGAFLGLHSVFLAQKVLGGQVIAFEPYSRNRQGLFENLALNELKNVKVFPVALGKKEGSGFIHGDDFTIRQTPRGEKITIVVGDDFIKKENLPIPQVIKMDVDGLEYQTLLGLKETLKNNTCRLLTCEVHPTLMPKNETPEMIFSLLKECGFSRIEKYNLQEVFHIFCKK